LPWTNASLGLIEGSVTQWMSGYRVEPDMGDHCGQENVLVRPKRRHTDTLPLQIGNAADAVIAKQFEAADMHAGQNVIGSPEATATIRGATKLALKSTMP
jgi:hypothetical protein